VPSSLVDFLWSTDFLPHGLCLSWRTDVVALMAGSDALIGLSYVSVAMSLGIFAWRRPDFPYPGIMAIFAMVFAMCGLSHFTDAASLWLPWYGAQALFKAAVAVVALPAAWAMWKLLPQALRLPSPETLRRANSDLAREIAQHRLTEEQLRAAKETAELASRARSDFLATMSHELRTPLNAVIGFADALTLNYFGSLNDRQHDYISSIHASGLHLLRLINDILDISKIDAGMLAIDEGDVAIPEVVAACVGLMAGNAGDAGVAVVTVVDSGLPRVRGDALRLKQVVLNLLSNAIKFTPRGGRVTIQVARLDDGPLTIEVADTGIGMRPEDVPKAFEMFTQIENPLTRRFSGTGIGLPLTRSLVELHGGRVKLDSVPGRGTTVTVCLPHERLLIPAV
jgi:signal transduction histidine kinase